MSSDNTDRVMNDLRNTIDNMTPPDAQGGVPLEQELRPVTPIRGNPEDLRSGREIADWEGTLEPSQREAWRRETTAARQLLNDIVDVSIEDHFLANSAWCMGIRIGARHVHTAYEMARQDPALKPHTALVELARVEAETLRSSAHAAEMERRRARMERNQRSLPQNRGHHPLRNLLDGLIGARGSVYTSPAILEKCAVSLDIQRFVDVLKQTCVLYGNLSETPPNSEMQFSLNFTPRMDTPRPAITVNMMAPIEAKFVMWNELDGTWNCRHNVVGAMARKVEIQPYQPETNPPVIRDAGCLHDEEVGKQSRSIQLD